MSFYRYSIILAYLNIFVVNFILILERAELQNLGLAFNIKPLFNLLCCFIMLTHISISNIFLTFSMVIFCQSTMK